MSSYTYQFKPLRVYVDGKYEPSLNVRELRRSVNGSKVDAAELEVTVGAKPLRGNLVGFGFTGEKLPIVEITTARRRVLFAGALTQKLPTLDVNTERVEYLVRAENFLFGNPVGFLPDYLALPPKNASAPGAELALYRPLIFNPEIDGQTRFNATRPSLTSKPDVKLFLEYDSTRTVKAGQTFGVSERLEWTLLDIVQYLCQVLNPQEKFAKNPTAIDLQLAFGSLAASPAESVRDFRVKGGDYLPDVLDDLLNPRGYAWFVKHERLGRRRLAFFRRGEGTGPALDVDLGEPGQALDTAKHNCCGISLKYDPAACANRVVVLGSKIRVEVTVELVRAWATEKDSSDRETLSRSDETADFDAVRDVWRKWALNESGDYTGLRTSITGYFNLPEYIGAGGDDVWVPRRREFLPTLTLGTDLKPIGQVGGCVVEFWNTAKEGGAGWDVIPDNMVCHLVEDECAVYFGGDLPPAEIYDAGADAKVRITATLETDLPLGHDVIQVSKISPTETPIPLVLRMDDHFHLRYITSQSQFKNQVEDGTFKSEQVDDTERLTAYAKRVLDAEDYGQVAGSLKFEGVDRWEVELGQPVPGAKGRDLDFNGRTGGVLLNGPKYPTVVGIAYDVDAQKTYVTLEHFRRHTLPEVT